MSGANTLDRGPDLYVNGSKITASNPVPTNSAASASGGTTLLLDSSVTATAETIKGSAGTLYWFEAQNLNAYDCWLLFFDATSPTETAPTLAFLVPAGDGVNYGTKDMVFPQGLAFANAIKYAATRTSPTADTAPGTALIANFGYA